MCGRYTLKTPIDVLAEYLGVEEYSLSLTSNYNIAPTQEVAAGVRMLIAWIPILGWVVAPIWSVVLAIFGIREAHHTITSRATLVVLIPSGPVLLLFLLFGGVI